MIEHDINRAKKKLLTAIMVMLIILIIGITNAC